jgi:diguanylate cyclase (GGDEF)-like protein
MPLTWFKQLLPQEHSAVSSAVGRTPHSLGLREAKGSGRAAFANGETEREQLTQELARTRERVAELTRSQVDLTSTISRLNELASTDVLTGLNNRRRFDEALQANLLLAIRQRSILSVIMLDVDRFKSYNDSFGHSAGDGVLCVVSEQLLRYCSSYDVAARIGGEEFAVLLPTADESQALARAEALRTAIATYPWERRSVTASFGVATFESTIKDPADLLKEADLALYVSKSRGRNCVTHMRDLRKGAAATSQSPESGPASGHEVGEKLGSDPNHDSSSDLSTNRDGEPAHSTIGSWPLMVRQARDDSVVDPLDHFLRELRDDRKTQELYHTALSAIREGIQADIVFTYSCASGQVVEIVGGNPPSPVWCSQTMQNISTELSRGVLWKNPERRAAKTIAGEFYPTAAVVFPAEDSRASWLVAVRLGEASPFVMSDLRLAQMIWKLQIEKKRHAKVHDNLKETLFGVIRCLSTAIDAKDTYTCGHSERVARIAVRLGKEMGLSGGEVSDLYLAGLLHDVGKIGSRDEVLLKPQALTIDEYRHIQKHAVIGERIVASVPRLAYLSPGVRGHHERLDGKGYPDGLAGEAIPMMARILAVADSCDAMMSQRRYRAGLSQARIEEIFTEGAGSQWDPGIVEHFFACRYDVYAVCQRGLGRSVYMAIERAAGADQEDHWQSNSIDRALKEARASSAITPHEVG